MTTVDDGRLAVVEGESEEQSTVDSQPGYATLILPGLFAVAVGLCFVYIGLDLLTNGGLTGLFSGEYDDTSD